VMNACIEQAGIKHVITSRKFMDKMNFTLNAEIVYLEDFKDKLTAADKAISYLQSYFLPARMLESQLGLSRVKSDDVLTVIFTSGSTGAPKGVMLTYANIASNIAAIDQVIHLRDTDVLIGILPFFHSLGYTVTVWGVASLNIQGAYHFSPLMAKQVGKLAAKYKGTILLCTPTFLRMYLRGCDVEDFKSLDVVVCGAEKLPKDLSDEFEKKFGVRPIEGYGTTELSPLASVNIPPSRSVNNFQADRKEGSVGRPVPGVTAKVTDLDSGEPLSAGKPGMLWIAGPNVMKGYLNQPEKTAEVIKDGWYQTGDVAFIDEEGFIHITGRESRFSKIGGEMVPHIQIEEELERIVGPSADGKPQIAVTAVPDAKKGERLVVLHTKLNKTPDDLRKGLTEAGLPNLFVPASDSFYEIDAIPILGTGKLDLRAVKMVAMAKAGKGLDGLGAA
jgi:acyl-[acyl-carrier-protein]-phospholipid O-acyltransferase/long-chain-fatty-acid--[acyl-carrier-protein] ligase